MEEALFKVTSIYDLMIIAYDRIRGKAENRILSRYYEEVQECFGEITYLMRELFTENLTITEFVKELTQYFSVDEEQVCMHLLMEFDRFYKERNEYALLKEPSVRKMMQYPMDSPVSECLAFYPMCEANFIMSSDVMKDARWHRIKRGIWDAIESYRIIELHESENKVFVKQYNYDGIEQAIKQNGTLTFAMIPFSNQDAFHRDEKTGRLELKSYRGEMGQIYEDCISLIRELDERAVNIVLFPEIVMTELLVEQIRGWIIKNASKLKHMKLLFMGTYYSGDVNQCVLLSGAGKRLLTNQKRNGFVYQDQKKERHRERLGDAWDEISLIDMKGLGRIWYLICKDFLVYEEVVSMVSKFGCNVQIASAYSKSISDFRLVGESLAGNCQSLFAVSNSCAVRTGKEIGLIGYPVFYVEGKCLTAKSLPYQCSVECERCAYARCAHLFRFSVHEKRIFQENCRISENKLAGMQIEYVQRYFEQKEKLENEDEKM